MRMSLVVLALLCWAISLQTQPLRAATGTVEDLRQFEKKLQEAVRRVAPAVVRVGLSAREVTERYRTQRGSGVVIDESGLVLTHGHQADPLDELFRNEWEVHFPDGRTAPAKLVRFYQGDDGDWSLLKIQKPGPWPAASLHEGKPPKVGDPCFHLGYGGIVMTADAIVPHAGPVTPCLQLGCVLALGRFTVYASCTLTSGDSGGPLFDLEGRVLGTAQGGGGWSGTSGYWRAVPSLVAARDLRELKDPDEFRRLGLVSKAGAPEIRELGISTKPFQEVLGPARRATVEILLDGRLVALGVVVVSDGVILTKRAEIMTRYGGPAGKLSCRLADGQTLAASIVADDHESDVALVRVDRKELPTVPWTEAKEVERASLVAAVGLGQDPLVVGVWGGTSQSFRVKPARGQVGFDGRATKGGVRVTEIVLHSSPEMAAKSPAAKEEKLPLKSTSFAWPALRGGELITHVDGKPVTDEESFDKATRGEPFLVGDLIRITILDNGKPREVVFPLMPSLAGGSVANLPSWMKHRMQGFPAVVAHDAVVAVDRCGGPVVDLTGHLVGINIANATWTRMLAIPHTVVRRLIDQMLAGPTAKPLPALVPHSP